MKRKNSLLLCSIIVAGLSLLSCQKSLNKAKDSLKVPEIAGQVIVPPTCGASTTVNLQDLGGNVSGTVNVSNDGTNYYFLISETVVGYDLSMIKLIYGDSTSVDSRLKGLIRCGYEEPTQNDVVQAVNPRQTEVLITVPISSISGSCFWFHVHATVASDYYSYPIWMRGELNASQNPCQDYQKYCRKTCPPSDCGGLRTQTMGGWGAVPQGNNPGTYLHANFAAAFGGSVSVGCNSGYKLTYTTAQAITDFLPASGKAAALTASATNLTSLKNTLAGQVLALSLSVGFDAWDPNFGTGTQTLGGMYIGSGTFAGMTVSQFLTIANNVLGGCSSAYTASQVNETASKINENYVDGTINLGYLTCTNPTLQ